MYPSAFDYSAPESLDEALATLGEVGDEGRVLAGGQSLIPMMKLRLAVPDHLVDINGVSELSYISESNGDLAVGALARHADIAASDLVSRTNSTMASAAPWISDPWCATGAPCAVRWPTATPRATGTRSCWRWAPRWWPARRRERG